MKRIVLIDDEVHVREVLRNLLSGLCPGVEIIGEADSVASGVQLIRQLKPEGILLDISMEDGTGFDLLNAFPSPDFKVIFVTAYDEFAIKAFKYNALDYLLKPVDPKELVRAIDKIKIEKQGIFQQKYYNFIQNSQQKQPLKIALNTQEGLVFIQLNQINYLAADSNYTTFFLLNKERIVVSRTLKDFEELLPPESFFRIHQSFMVSLDHVQKVLKEDGGFALVDGGIKIPVARRRKENFLKALGV
jgi:two-component system LytT family response regulator